MRLQRVVRNHGDLAGSGTVLWTVDGATLGVTLVDLAAGEERLVERVWTAAAGDDQTLRWQWLVVGVTLLAGTTAAGALWWFNRVPRSRW